MNIATNLIYFICVFLINFVNCQVKNLGDKCIINQINVNGTCKFIDDCPYLVKRMENEFDTESPTLCDSENSKDIFCCPYIPEFNMKFSPFSSIINTDSAKSKFFKKNSTNIF